jgi:acetyltransferase-like isoleucine patch superfamily enzyme
VTEQLAGRTLLKNTFEDPVSLFSRLVSKLRTIWLTWTYPFYSVGSNFWAHSSCELSRSVAPYVKIGNRVIMDRDVWLNVPYIPKSSEPVIVIEDGCQIGRRCLISAQNRVQIGKNTIFGPSVVVVDHDDALHNLEIPILDQGTKNGGKVRIEEGCWIGFRAAIVCSHGELIVGKNSVIGANTVVTNSIPPYSVVSGNPGRVVKQFDPFTGQWVIGRRGFNSRNPENKRAEKPQS